MGVPPAWVTFRLIAPFNGLDNGGPSHPSRAFLAWFFQKDSGKSWDGMGGGGSTRCGCDPMNAGLGARSFFPP